MRRRRRAYPTHALPYLAHPTPEAARPVPRSALIGKLSPAQVVLLERLAQGVRVLLDVERRRALLYSFQRGAESLGELSVRMLARLVRWGYLVATGREGRLVHYGLVTRSEVRA